MRVLLARRFRGNTNEAQASGEEGEETQQVIEEQQLESESTSQSLQGQLKSQPQEAQSESNQAKGHSESQQPRQNLPTNTTEICENTSPQQDASEFLSRQKQNKQLKQPSLRKRRLGERSLEEKDHKQRRCHTPSSSTIKVDLSALDQQQSVLDTGVIGHNRKQASTGDFDNSKVASTTGPTPPPAKEAPSPSNPLKPKSKYKMVSSGAGRRSPLRHGHSRQREEEHFLDLQYRVNNHQAHDSHDEPEVIVRQAPEMDFERPLENDPASARGDVSLTSPERQRHNQVYDLQASSSSGSTDFSIGQRDEKQSSNSNSNKKRPCTSNDEMHFRAILKKERGLEIREQEGDGNCLFRAISLQVYGDPSMHGDVRKQCMDHMERDQEHFSQFVTGQPFLQYIARTRRDGVHGNNPEIQSCSELFNRPIEVFTPENGSKPINIFHAEYKTGDVPIRLSYHDGNHYNAVIDPLVPTAGLGLGLPGLKPGYADKMQMDKAVAESIDAAADQDEVELQQVLKASKLEYNVKGDNDDDLQRAIKESQLSAEHINSNNALSLSDMDATYFELEQAALEQSLQSMSQKDEGKKRSASTTASKLKSGDGAEAQITVGDYKAPAVAPAASSSATASLPCPSQESIPLAAAASSPVASAASGENESSQQLLPIEEYPSSVQELVMNGFTLSAVVKAFDLVGDNFDHMLSLCLANGDRAP